MAIPLTLSEVPDTVPYIQYVATAGQTVYPYPFPITQDSDLVVVINGVTQATDSTYSLTGQGNDTGGNCVLNAGSAAGDIVTLYRDIAIERITQFSQNSGFSSAAFNAEFNNLYLIMQQLESGIAQCLQIPNTNNPAPITTLTPSAYADKYLSFDSYGNPQPALLTSSGTVTAALITGLLYPQTPSELAAGITPANEAVPHHLAAGEVLTTRYGINAAPGTTDMTTAINNAVAVAKQLISSGLGGSTVRIVGTNFHSGSIQLFQGIEVYSDAYPQPALVKTADFETFNTSASGNIIGLLIRDLFIQNTFSGATTKYDIHLINVSFGRLERVTINNTLSTPTSYSSTNTGGIWFSNSGGSGVSECNWIDKCFIQDNSVWWGVGVTDSTIQNSVVWGSNRNFAIRIDDADISVIDNPDLLGSQYNGTVYITSTAAIPRICGNFFDGGQPGTTSGSGLNVDFCNEGICNDNYFFNLYTQGIILQDANFWTFTGNNYHQCNRGNGSYDDVLLQAAIACKGNCFSNESHTNTVATSKGYPYREVNTGAAPGTNQYQNCRINDGSTGYPNNGIALSKPNTSVSGTLNGLQEGTFVPTLQGSSSAGTTTYNSVTAGFYKLLGNVCFFELSVTVATTTGATGSLVIGGLPFAAALNTATVEVGGKAAITTTYARLSAQIQSGSQVISLLSDDGSDNSAQVAASALANGTAINVSGFYFIG